METQPQLLLLQKTLLMAEGMCRRLSPEENMWVLAKPQIERWARENLGPEARLRDADRLHSKCRDCQYRKICGGSRARAYALTGDLYASEPDCVYVPPESRRAV